MTGNSDSPSSFVQELRKATLTLLKTVGKWSSLEPKNQKLSYLFFSEVQPELKYFQGLQRANYSY